jgi:hypothetical protein
VYIVTFIKSIPISVNMYVRLSIGIIALLLTFLFSSGVAGWFVWGIYGIVSIFLFIKSFTEYKSMLKGDPKSVTDVMGIALLFSNYSLYS